MTILRADPTVKIIERDRWGRPLIIPPEGGKPVPYTRPSSLGRVLTDDTTLTRWKQRQTALGLAKRPDLLTMVAARHDDRAALNELCEQAMQAVGSDAGATMGTALHELTEQLDLGHIPGEHTPPAALERLRLYWRALRVGALQPVEVELFVVCDQLKVAGTLDRLYQWQNRTVIGDLKTGMSLMDDQGRMWPNTAMEIAVQLACYANSSRYDPATGTRQPQHTHPARATGLVVHLPSLSGPARIIRMDLDMGMVLARLARDVLDARKTRDLTSTLHSIQPKES